MWPRLHVVGSWLSFCVILSAQALAQRSGSYSLIRWEHVCVCTQVQANITTIFLHAASMWLKTGGWDPVCAYVHMCIALLQSQISVHWVAVCINSDCENVWMYEGVWGYEFIYMLVFIVTEDVLRSVKSNIQMCWSWQEIDTGDGSWAGDGHTVITQ